MPTFRLPDGRVATIPDNIPEDEKRVLGDAIFQEYGIDIYTGGQADTKFGRFVDVMSEAPSAFARGGLRTTLGIPTGVVAAGDLGNDSEAYKGLRQAQKWISEDSAIKVNRDYQDNYFLKLMEGAGSILPYIGGGAAQQILRKKGKNLLGAGVMSGIAGSGGVSQQAELQDISKEMGVDISPAQEIGTEIGGFVTGLTEIFPVQRAFRGITKSKGRYDGGFDLKRALLTGAAEGGQEVTASWAQNFIARTGYNPDLPIQDSYMDDFTIGGIIGFGMDTLVNSIGGKRSISKPYMYKEEADLREQQENLLSEERARRKSKYESAINSDGIYIAPEDSELDAIPDLPLPEGSKIPPNLQVIENANATFSIIDSNDIQNPVLETFQTEDEALIARDRIEREYSTDFIREVIENDLYNLGLRNSSTAKSLAVSLVSPNSISINSKIISMYDNEISQARKDQLIEEKKLDEKIIASRAGYGAWLWRDEIQKELNIEKANLASALGRRKPQVNMLEAIKDKAEKKNLERQDFYNYAETKKILNKNDFNALVKEKAAVTFKTSEKMAKPSIVADKIDLKQLTTPKAIKEFAKSKNINLDFKDPAVKFAAEMWTGTANYQKMSQSQKELFLARLDSLSSFNQETKFPDFRPRNYSAQDTANFVAAVSTDVSFSREDVSIAVGKENTTQFIDDLISSGRAEKISNNKYQLLDNYQFNIARRAEGFKETPEEFGQRLTNENQLTEEVINELVQKEQQRQEGFIAPKEIRKKILDFDQETKAGSISNFAQQAKKILNQVGLKETGVIISNDLLSTSSLREVGDKIIFDTKQTKKAEGEYDTALDTIFLALDKIDPDGTLTDAELEQEIANLLDHEIVHPLIEKDLFKEKELLYLQRLSKQKVVPKAYDINTTGKETFYDRAKRLNPQITQDPTLSPEVQEQSIYEEAIAELYRARTIEDVYIPPKADTILQKITNFFKAIIKAMRSVGYSRADKIFSDIEQGRIGRRERNKIRTLKYLDLQKDGGFVPDVSKFSVGDSVPQGITKVNTYNDPEVAQTFWEVADYQRGAPEYMYPLAMFAQQGSYSSNGPMDAGDLVYVIAGESSGRTIDSGVTFVSERIWEKITKPFIGDFTRVFEDTIPEIGAVKGEYWLQRGFDQSTGYIIRSLKNSDNLQRSAERKEIGEITVENVKAYQKRIGTKYANEYRKMPAYNEAQYHARELAIAVGEMDVEKGKPHAEYFISKRGKREITMGGSRPLDNTFKEFMKEVKTAYKDKNGNLMQWEDVVAASESRTDVPKFSVATTNPNPIIEAAVGIDLMSGREKLPNIKTKKDLAKALEKRTRQANNGKPLISFDQRGAIKALDSKQVELLAEMLALESQYAMSLQGNASNWYKNELQTAMDYAGDIFPNIKNNPQQQDLLKIIMGITSNGLSVKQNTNLAINVYENYLGAGQIFGEGSGTSKKAMENSFALLNTLIQSNGLESTLSFMKRNIPVKDLDAVMSFATGLKKSVGLESKNAIVKGSSMFGPKIGGGFIPNLLGDYNALTPDRWFMRSWGRVTGTLSSSNQKALNSSLSKFRSTIKAGDARKLGIPIDQIRKNDDVAVTTAIRLYRDFAKRNFQNSTALDKAARSVWSSDKELTAPKTITEVENMRKVMSRSVELLKEKGYPDIDVATVQASLWYAEKDLYNKYLDIKNEVTSYAEQFKEAAKERGVDESNIDRTSATARQRITGSVQQNTREAGQEPNREVGTGVVETNVIDVPKFSVSKRKEAERKGFDTSTVLYHGSSGFRIPTKKDIIQAKEFMDEDGLSFFVGHTSTGPAGIKLGLPSRLIDRDVALKGEIDDRFLQDKTISLGYSPDIAYQYAATKPDFSEAEAQEIERILNAFINQDRYQFTKENLQSSLRNALPLSYIYPVYLKKDIMIFNPIIGIGIASRIDKIEQQPRSERSKEDQAWYSDKLGLMDFITDNNLVEEHDVWVRQNVGSDYINSIMSGGNASLSPELTRKLRQKVQKKKEDDFYASRDSRVEDDGTIVLAGGPPPFNQTITLADVEAYGDGIADILRYVLSFSRSWAWQENPATRKILEEMGFDGVASVEQYRDDFITSEIDEKIFDDANKGQLIDDDAYDEFYEMERINTITKDAYEPQLRIFNPEKNTFIDSSLIIEVPSPTMTSQPNLGGFKDLSNIKRQVILENYKNLNSFREAQQRKGYLLLNYLTPDDPDFINLDVRKAVRFPTRETGSLINRSEGLDVSGLNEIENKQLTAIEAFINEEQNFQNRTGNQLQVDILEADLLNALTYRKSAIDAQAEQGVIKDENIQASERNKAKINTARNGGFTDIIRSREGRTFEQTSAINRQKNKILQNDEQNTALAVANLYNKKLNRGEYLKKNVETNPEFQKRVANNYEVLANELTNRVESVRESIKTRVAEPITQKDVLDALTVENELTMDTYNSFVSLYPQLVKDHNIRNYKDLVIKSYSALEKEIEMQYAELLNTGITIEYHDGAAEYMDSSELQSDVILYDHLWTFKGGEPHYFLNKADINGITLDHKFRSIHDYFGHVVNNNPFGASGEETAFASHVQMFSPLAAIAMASETRGQNSYVNYANDGELNSDLLYLSDQAARSKKLLEMTNDPVWGDYANNLSDIVGDNFRYAKQVPVVLNAEFLTDSIPDNVKGVTVSEGRRKATELTEKTNKGLIPYYNTNASDVALDAATEFNEDLAAVAPKDIPKFSAPSIPFELQEAIDVIGKPDTVNKSWGARLLKAFEDPFKTIGDAWETTRETISDGYTVIDRRIMEMSEDNPAVRELNNRASVGAIQALRMSDSGAALTQKAMLLGIPVEHIEGVASLTNVVPLMDGDVEIGGPTTFLAPLFADPSIDGEAIFKLLLVADRGSYLNQKGIRTPVNELVIEKAAWVRQQPQYQAIVKATEHYRLWDNALISYAKAKGLVSEEMESTLQESFYYPFYRKMEDGDVEGVDFASNYLSANPLSVKQKGSDKELNLNPLEAISRNALAIMTASLKNDGAYKLVKSMEAYGSAKELLGKERENISSLAVIKVYKDGQQSYWQIDDPEIYHSFQALGVSPYNNALTRLLAGTSGFLRDMITRDPGFIAVNLLRDTISAAVTSGSNYIPIIDTLKGFVGDISELENFGIVRGYDASNDSADIVKMMRKSMKEQGLTEENGMDLKDMFVRLWDGLGGLTTKSDGATRMATYVDVYKHMKEQGYSEAEARSEGAYQGLEIINFGRRGNSPLFRTISASIPFLNARVQGLDVLYRSMAGKYSARDRLLEGDTLDTIKKRIATKVYTRMLLLSMTTIAYYMMVKDEDEYRNNKREKRDNNYLLPTPFGALWFPIAFEVGIITKVIPERILDMLMADPVEQDPLKSFYLQANNSLNFPITQAGLGIQLFKPLHEVIANRNDYTGSEIVPYHMLGLEPELQAYRSTNAFSKQLGDFFDMSPLKIDHILNGYSGTLGGYVLSVMDMAVRQATGEPFIPTQVGNMPLIKRFYKELGTGGGLQQQFYELGSQINTFVQTTNFLRKNNRFDELAIYMHNNQGLMNVKGQVRATEKYLSYWRQRRDRLYLREDLDQKQKRAMMKDLILERDQRLIFVPELIKRSKQQDYANRR